MAITISELNFLLERHYNITGKVIRLEGDVDYNFKVVACDQVYLLKVCRENTPKEVVQFQVDLLQYIVDQELPFTVPSIKKTVNDSAYLLYEFLSGPMYVRVHSWVDGYLLNDVNPRTKKLYHSWGKTCGLLSKALIGFDHIYAHRFDKWNPIESIWSRKYIDCFEERRKALAIYFWDYFENTIPPILESLRSSINYSDAHEHNLILTEYESISGVIDFGDAVYGPTISELAIACAYAGMNVEDPIETMSYVIEGYHEVFPLQENEIECLYALICGRLMITVANAANKKYEEPDNLYLQISAEPAWNLLEKLSLIDSNFIHYYFRSKCNLEPCPKKEKWDKWFVLNKEFIGSPINVSKHKVTEVDLSVGSLDLGNNSNFLNTRQFCRTIDSILFEQKASLGIGGYCEVRPFYTTDAYKVEGNNGPRWRTMHLGTDYWVGAGEDVFAVYDGVVHSFHDNNNPCDYGPTVILEHKSDCGVVFYSLYGHLSLDSLDGLSVGLRIGVGEKIARVGEADVNGDWPPHLHFQLILDMLGKVGDFPGVCFVEEVEVWASICPNIAGGELGNGVNDIKASILKDRSTVLGENLSIAYKRPLHIVRGYGQYLYDNAGRRYLDMVNNVAHVGHEHPDVVRAGKRQMSVLNTNTRYLHHNIAAYASRLLEKCPDGLDKVYFVNSGSEANELAIRMAKAYSNQKDIIALEVGYHGNTGSTIDVSSYKFEGKGGEGTPEYTSIVPMPDLYRGECKDDAIASKYYSQYIGSAIAKLKDNGRNVAGFIAESILSCGGQVMLPTDYLKESYKLVRSEGGLCIADEVQVGFGRVGDHFWGFELQDVVPDIITCGKPIGNGHPLAAVITSGKVSDAFTNGMEYFNTFGGNPVSCAIGVEVLNVIEKEGLQQKAKNIGSKLLSELLKLQNDRHLIGDVRGIGLFCGIELVRGDLEPATTEATYIVNRMRELGVLLSVDGPSHNVIKMKPPMCITEQNIKDFITRLDNVFDEVESLSKFKKWNERSS